MKIPLNRRQFENHQNILKDAILDGRYVISSGFSAYRSLKAITILPNNRLDLVTVDDITRNMANTYATILATKKVNHEKDDDDI
jgi:hypothetical protein